MLDDTELLHRYAEEKSEVAFAELVRRHVNFVYACALRRVGGDSHLAEDVTQQVFTALARGARALARREVLSGWLFTSARNASAQVVRSERRRLFRESEAQSMNELTSFSAHDAAWARLRPVLDGVMDELCDADREAVLLRFFEGKSFADVGARLRLTENAARMRVERALDKMHPLLARCGVTSTTSALALALANQATVAAPVGLAATVTGAAMASAAAGGGGLAATIVFVSMTKLQIGVTGALAVAVGTGYFLQTEINARLRHEVAVAQAQQQAVATLRAENQRLASTVAEIEMLRRDDVELKQLAQRAAEVKKANEENARLGRARAQNRRSGLADQIREEDRLAQVEVERMNREGNALVKEYKEFAARAKDGSLPAETRAQAEAAAKTKLEEIKTKKGAIQAFIEKTRRVLAEKQTELRRIAPGDAELVNPALLRPSAGKFELSRSPAIRDEAGSAHMTPTEGDRVSLRLPQADRATAFAAYESLAGVKIIRDPSVATARGTVELQFTSLPRAAAIRALQIAFRDQLSIVLEPAPDGNLVAKLAPPR